MSERAFGVIVPSSNRNVERTTEAVLSFFPELAACYARIPLFGAGKGQPSDGYNLPALDDAVELLSHAQIELLCWNGTKGAQLGFAPDRDLCVAAQDRYGLPMVTTSLAALEVLARLDVKRFALVSPAPEASAAAMASNFQPHGFEPVGVVGMGLTDNFAFSEVTPHQIQTAARQLFRDCQPDAILLFNTNFRGLSSSAPLESELGVPVIDSTAIGVWAVLNALGVDPTPAASLGRLFSMPN